MYLQWSQAGVVSYILSQCWREALVTATKDLSPLDFDGICLWMAVCIAQYWHYIRYWYSQYVDYYILFDRLCTTLLSLSSIFFIALVFYFVWDAFGICDEVIIGRSVKCLCLSSGIHCTCRKYSLSILQNVVVCDTLIRSNALESIEKCHKKYLNICDSYFEFFCNINIYSMCSRYSQALQLICGIYVCMTLWEKVMIFKCKNKIFLLNIFSLASLCRRCPRF